MANLIEVGIVGSRGYAGEEFSKKLKDHPNFTEVKFDSRTDPFGKGVPDAVILALPDKVSEAYIKQIIELKADPVIIDLSSDHRSVASWTYGVTEHNRESIAKSRRISNPGCYATGMQLGIKPALEFIDINSPIIASGTSGYSGAGKTPSRTNDLVRLTSNHVIPYKTIDHHHEKEVAEHLAIDRNNLKFLPRSANFFRGIILELRMKAKYDGITVEELAGHYRNYYKDEHLIQVTNEWPDLADVVNTDMCLMGGFQVSGREMALVVVLDNLGKGAAGQAMQNLNVVFGIQELTGLAVNVKK